MSSDEQRRDAYLLSSVNNALKILELLMVRDNIRLKEITALTGLDRTSVFKMLYTLEYRGFVVKDHHAHYRLGNMLAAYRQLSTHWNRIADLATPAMVELWAKTQKTVMLGVMGTDERVVIVSLRAERGQDSIVGRIGAEMDVHTSSIGKVLLAHMEPDTWDDIIARNGLERHTDYTIADPSEFRKCLSESRSSQWVVTYEENHLDHCDIASPIYDYSNSCVAALCVITDRQSMDANLPFYRSELLKAASQVSEELGYKAYLPDALG